MPSSLPHPDVHRSLTSEWKPSNLVATEVSGFRGFGMPAYEDIIFSLAKRVQLLRKNLGMTQAALALRAGVTVETVARLERVVRGRISANSNPSLETLTRLASALEIELHELLTAEPAVQRKSHQLEYLLDSASPASTRRIMCVAEALLREEHAESRQVTQPLAQTVGKVQKVAS